MKKYKLSFDGTAKKYNREGSTHSNPYSIIVEATSVHDAILKYQHQIGLTKVEEVQPQIKELKITIEGRIGSGKSFLALYLEDILDKANAREIIVTDYDKNFSVEQNKAFDRDRRKWFRQGLDQGLMDYGNHDFHIEVINYESDAV